MTNPSKLMLPGAALVFIASLLLYSWTLAPTVTLVDSGELIVAADSLGVAHPPGFPLYLLLAHLASLVPVGTVATRVNFASGFFAALAAAMLTLVVAELSLISRHVAALELPRKKIGRKKRKQSRQTIAATTDNEETPLIVLAPAVGAGLLFAFSRTLWGLRNHC